MSLYSIGVFIEMDPMGNFLVGSNASVTCKSDINANQIDWLNSESGVIISVTGQKRLNLTFNPVHDANHSEVYTCRVTRSNEMRNENITVHQNFTVKAQGKLMIIIIIKNSCGCYCTMIIILYSNTFHAVPSDILKVDISRQGSERTGEMYNLSCSILKMINGLALDPTATWTVNGEYIQEGSGISIHSLETSQSTLTFNPLKTSHAGNYSCCGNLTSSAPPHQFSVFSYHPFRVSSELKYYYVCSKKK